MKKTAKLIIAGVVIISMLNAVPAFAETYVLEVSIETWDAGRATVTDAIEFPEADAATTEEPWIIAPQYIRVKYSSTEALVTTGNIWGIRIATANEDTYGMGQIYPKPINPGSDAGSQWRWIELGEDKYYYRDVDGDGDSEWDIGDDSVSFGGLINSGSRNNPKNRPALAWQVFSEPISEPYEIWKDWFGNWNVGGDSASEWAYMVDISDKWNGADSFGGVFYPSPPAPADSPKFEMVATGSGDEFDSLTAHPPSGDPWDPDPIRPGDGWDIDGDGMPEDVDINGDGHMEHDLAIYIAACFGVPSDDVPGEYEATVAAGDYGTVVYIQLIHSE